MDAGCRRYSIYFEASEAFLAWSFIPVTNQLQPKLYRHLILSIFLRLGSKFALEGISDSMRYSLAPFGIFVSNVNAGPIRYMNP